MMRRYIFLLGLCFSFLSFATEANAGSDSKDLYLGEAFYYAFQGEYVDAITRLDTELGQFYRLDDPNLDPLHFQVNFANFSVGDFELSYRMHQRAGRAIKSVLEGNVDQQIRNEAAYRLARIYVQKDDPKSALSTIEKITGKIPEKIRDDELFLRAQIYMLNGKFEDAIKILQGLQGNKEFEGFSTYNLGIALIQNGQEVKGFEQLDKAGQINSDDEAALAIRDKANMFMGNRLIAAGKPALAKQFLDRVRLNGPFSNKALLGSGWTDMALEKYDRALVPWSILIKRNVTDKAVQESLLGTPYAYAKLGLHGRAALFYGSALEAFGSELGKLDASIKSIREGKFLLALFREELKLDKNWVVKLRELPESPDTYYLLELMASNDFQEALQNYFDLDDLRSRLEVWDGNIDAYEEIIRIRAKYYEAILPDLDKRFREIDTQMKLRLEQRQALDDRLKLMLVSPRTDFLETADERAMRNQLRQQEQKYKNDNSASGIEARRRITRLQGVLNWQIKTTYDKRLTEAYKHLHQLDGDVEKLREIYRSFVRSRQAATQSYKGYDNQLRQLRNRIRDAREKVNTLMARQGNMLNVMAINELDQRRKRLEEFQVQARFALSESYDRASKKQMDESGQK
jgi:predicted negative regulator of RcsB-dependent stress response